MTALLKCEKISKEYGDRIILKDINLSINFGDKIGIVGENGAGKTTLADIISGRLECDGGQVIWYKSGVQVGYMQQATEYSDLDSTLSGGEKTKKLLKEVLYNGCSFMILDEPTNHLDYEGVSWLIKKVKEFKGTVIIISHDRYFLDKCVNHIIEIENGGITSYNGNYTWYREKKKKDYEDNLHAYIEQEKVKAGINGKILELRAWSAKAHRDAAQKAIETGNKFGGKQFNRAKAKRMDARIKSQIKRLEKIDTEGVKKPKEEDKVYFNVDDAGKTGSVIVSAKDISKEYNGRILFNQSSFYIKQGDKIGVYGSNGCGKSTLIKGILGQSDIDGELYMSSARKAGYISQDVIDLDDDAEILEVFNAENRAQLGQIRTELNLMGFDKDSLDKKIGCLSLGERMKIKLLLMIREECEVLILDEPTNHIDLHVREVLEEALMQYNGTIILITHDRYMMEKICDKLLVFENKKIKRYEYGFKEYLERKETKKKDTKRKAEDEEKIIIDNKISCVISELSCVNRESERYKELDAEYNRLLKIKKNLIG